MVYFLAIFTASNYILEIIVWLCFYVNEIMYVLTFIESIVNLEWLVPNYWIPSHIDTWDFDLETRLLLPLDPRDPLRRLPMSRPDVLGAKVSTIIFWDVSLKLSQSMDLNILRARFISFDFVHGIINVSFISAPGDVGFLPITKNLLLLCLLTCSAQHLSSAANSNLGFLRLLISSLVPFQARKTWAFFPYIFRGRILAIRTFTTAI